MMVAELLNAVVSGLVALCSVAFLAEYTRRARWEAHAVGRYFVIAVATIGLLGLYTVVITFIDLDGTLASVLRVVRSLLLLGIAGLLVQATVSVRRAYPRRRKNA
ncbi:hypothetical protein JHN63_01790 [Streptomyces sp. MBT65]|uniref:putative phage holin n=1 Tax=Streptomyces sp. MBT65 TaxID=1488395 RepID=UPI00190B88FE|nr:hypothetical protein [Streptomyces sp. MBT65]MBK3572573.1 hypothetical protein [Streptomyces sp. MBT65]